MRLWYWGVILFLLALATLFMLNAPKKPDISTLDPLKQAITTHNAATSITARVKKLPTNQTQIYSDYLSLDLQNTLDAIPPEANELLISWALANQQNIPTLVLIEAVHRAAKTNQMDRALDLYALARIKLAEDGLLCSTKLNGAGVNTWIINKLQATEQFKATHQDAVVTGYKNRLAFIQQYPSRFAPIWLCAQSDAAVKFDPKDGNKIVAVPVTQLVADKTTWPKRLLPLHQLITQSVLKHSPK